MKPLGSGGMKPLGSGGYVRLFQFLEKLKELEIYFTLT